MEWAKTATPEERIQTSGISSVFSKEKGLSYEDVRALHEKPMQNMLPSFINVESHLLCKLDFAVLYTEDEIGFITSDSPCVWFDPEACSDHHYIDHQLCAIKPRKSDFLYLPNNALSLIDMA